MGKELGRQFRLNLKDLSSAGILHGLIPGLPHLPFIAPWQQFIIGWQKRSCPGEGLSRPVALPSAPEQVEALRLDRLNWVGYGLIPIVDEEQNGDLLHGSVRSGASSPGHGLGSSAACARQPPAKPGNIAACQGTKWPRAK
jgi:hypothetical protein